MVISTNIYNLVSFKQTCCCSCTIHFQYTFQDSPVKCSALEEDKTLIVCDDIGNPLKKGKLVSFVLKISSNRLLPTEDSLNITTWVNT